MAKLISPGGMVIREARPLGNGSPGKWHFKRRNSERLCVCGYVLHDSDCLEIQAVEKIIAKDLCKTCWPYEVE